MISKTILFHSFKNLLIFSVFCSFVIASFIIKNRFVKKLNVIIIASFSFLFESFDFAIKNTMNLFSKFDVFLTKFEKIDVWWWDSNYKIFDMMYVFFDVLNFLIDIAISSFFIIFLRICDRVFRDFTSNLFVLKSTISSLILKTSLRLKRFCWSCSFFKFRRFERICTNVTKRIDSFDVFLSLMMNIMMNLSRAFDWTT